MGETTRGDDTEPSLELPSLFRRRRRGRAEPGVQSEPVREVEPEPLREAESERLREVAREREPDVAPEPEPEARAEAPIRPDPVVVAPPAPAPEPVAAPPAAPVAPPPSAPAAQPGGAAVAGGRRRAAPTASRSRRVPRTGPQLPARLAALLTGLAVGLVGTVLTYGGLTGCELVRGTDSCGGGPGLLLLVGILVVMVLAGGGLLAWLGVADPRSTSFLGVGITAVVAMVALLDLLTSAWMFVVVPVLSGAAYLLAWWVTTRLVEQLDDGPGIDVR